MKNLSVKKVRTIITFGINVAYGEEDRQMIDYLMANGDFDGALRIHQQYIDNKD